MHTTKKWKWPHTAVPAECAAPKLHAVVQAQAVVHNGEHAGKGRRLNTAGVPEGEPPMLISKIKISSEHEESVPMLTVLNPQVVMAATDWKTPPSASAPAW